MKVFESEFHPPVFIASKQGDFTMSTQLHLRITVPMVLTAVLTIGVALATTTQAGTVWGNLTYNAGKSGMEKSAKQYEGAYSFSVDEIVGKDSTVTGLKITELSGPFAPNIGDFTTIPVKEGDNDILFDTPYVATYHPRKGSTPIKVAMDKFEGTYIPATESMNFTVTRKGAVEGTSWSFASTSCVGMPEPPTHILLVIGLAGGTIAYGWRRRREQRRQHSRNGSSLQKVSVS
jgi:hypothetical protein